MDKIKNYIDTHPSNIIFEKLNIISEYEIYFNCKMCNKSIKTSYKNIKRRIRENSLLLCQSCNKLGDNNPGKRQNPYRNLSAEQMNDLREIKSINAIKNNLHEKGYNSQTNRLSNIHKKLINLLQELNIKEKFKTEYKLSSYYFDEASEYYSLIIEVNGDYFHANPNKYKADDYIRGKWASYYAKDKWAYDEKRKTLAIQNGFDILTVWESDFKNLSSIKQLIKDKINGK